MSITVFPKTVKRFTVINDKLFEDEMATPAMSCYSGENGTLEIRVTLDWVWFSMCPMIECENMAGGSDKGGVVSDHQLTYTVPKALMRNGTIRFHLRGILDGKIRKTADAEITVQSSFDCSKEAEKYEPSAFDDLVSNVAAFKNRLETAELSVERLASELKMADIKYDQALTDRDFVTSAILTNAPVKNLDYAFEASAITEFPALNMSKVESMQYAFRNCESLLSLPDMDLTACTTLYECFRQCSNLKTVGKLITPNVKKMYSLFRNCLALETIEEIDLSSVDSMNLIFANCRNLKNITFAGSINISLDLRPTPATTETVMSAINALCENGDGKILYLGNLADKITAEQKKIAADKGWVIE